MNSSCKINYQKQLSLLVCCFRRGGVAEAVKLISDEQLKKALIQGLAQLKSQCDIDPSLVNDNQQDLLKRILGRCLFSQGGIGLQDKNDISTLSNSFSSQRDLAGGGSTDYERILESALYEAFGDSGKLLAKYEAEEQAQERLAKRQVSNQNLLTKVKLTGATVFLALVLASQVPDIWKFFNNKPAENPPSNPPTEVERDPVSEITNVKSLKQLQNALDKHAQSAGIVLRNGSDTDSERGVILCSDNNNFDIDNFTVNGSRVDLAKTIWNILEKSTDDPASWNRRREKMGDGYLIYIGRKNGTW